MYGRCIVADYNSVHKDKCAAEFMKLKDCYLVIVSLPLTSCTHSRVTKLTCPQKAYRSR